MNKDKSWKIEVRRELGEARVALLHMAIGLMIGWSLVQDVILGEATLASVVWHGVWFLLAAHSGVVVTLIIAAVRGIRNRRKA